jgi:hypothetical protein
MIACCETDGCLLDPVFHIIELLSEGIADRFPSPLTIRVDWPGTVEVSGYFLAVLAFGLSCSW